MLRRLRFVLLEIGARFDRSDFRAIGSHEETWIELVNDFGKLFYTVAGKPEEVDSRRTRDGTHRHKATQRARELMAANDASIFESWLVHRSIGQS